MYENIDVKIYICLYNFATPSPGPPDRPPILCSPPASPPECVCGVACGGAGKTTFRCCNVCCVSVYVTEVNWIFLYLCSTLWGATTPLPHTTEPLNHPTTEPPSQPSSNPPCLQARIFQPLPHLAAGKSCLNAALASIKNNIPQRTLLNYTILTVKQQPAPSPHFHQKKKYKKYKREFFHFTSPVEIIIFLILCNMLEAAKAWGFVFASASLFLSLPSSEGCLATCFLGVHGSLMVYSLGTGLGKYESKILAITKCTEILGCGEGYLFYLIFIPLPKLLWLWPVFRNAIRKWFKLWTWGVWLK